MQRFYISLIKVIYFILKLIMLIDLIMEAFEGVEYNSETFKLNTLNV